MNIYQHLLLLVPISFLFWFGVIRFNLTNGVIGKKCYPALSGIATGFCMVLSITYGTINRNLPVELYTWLGTL